MTMPKKLLNDIKNFLKIDQILLLSIRNFYIQFLKMNLSHRSGSTEKIKNKISDSDDEYLTCEYIENESEHEYICNMLSSTLEHLQKRIDISENSITSLCSQSAFDKYYNSGQALLKKLKKYKATPKFKLTRYDRLKRSALSIIDFENGVGEWISTFDVDVFYDLQFELMITHGPNSFQQQTNYIRFPIIEYIIFVPRDVALISNKNVNSFTHKLFQYIESGNAVLLPYHSNYDIRKEIQTASFSCKRILKHSIPACMKLIQNNPSWQMYIINIESKEPSTNDAEQFTEQLISILTELVWCGLDHTLLNAINPEIMKHNLFVNRIGKTEISCFTKRMSKIEILSYVAGFDSLNSYSIGIN